MDTCFIGREDDDGDEMKEKIQYELDRKRRKYRPNTTSYVYKLNYYP